MAGARAERAALAVLLHWTAVLALFVGGFSCAVSRPFDLPAPAEAAVAPFDEARAVLRELDARASDADPDETRRLEQRARELLEEAERLDAGWAPPGRFLDDLDRGALRGTRAYERRLERLERAPQDAVALYLAGRLEVDRSAQRFTQALAADPSLAWAHHGLSVAHQGAGRPGPTLGAARRAFERARGGFETSFFGRRLAELLAGADKQADARRVLEQALEREGLAAIDRLELALALARDELDADDAEVVERGYRRGLELVAGGALQREELAALLGSLSAGRAGRSSAAWAFDVRRALDAGGAGERFGLDPAALLEPGLVLVGFALGESDDATIPAAERRASAFRGGRAAAAVEAWRAALPARVVDGAGRPLDPQLAAVVDAAAALPADGVGDAAALARLADACLAAGWFDEALALAGALHRAGAGVEDVEQVEFAARAGRALVGEIAHVLGAVQGGPASWWFERDPRGPPDEPPQGLDAPRPAERADARASERDLSGVLDAIARLAAAYGGPLGLASEALGERVRGSPRLAYGPFAEVLVPGPVFAQRDEALGLGEAGAPVPGLAELMAKLGRVALVGEGLGRGPDGTVLRRLAHERVAGERLGVPFEGLLVWCEGADASGGIARTGGLVSGAALHEGYWIDVESERRRRQRWIDLERRYLSGDDTSEAEAVLAEPGLALGGDPRTSDLARHERRRVAPPLGAADRLRLAILLERRAHAAAGSTDDLVALDELLHVVAVHEEGHLIDRTRFLPLGRRALRVLRFALFEGFSPAGIESELERRAQLVALCEVPDPRLALVDVLEAAELPRAAAGSHARGYAELLGELLLAIDRELERAPDAFPALDRDRTLVHQLHRLTPEEVRALALEVARRGGMVGGS